MVFEADETIPQLAFIPVTEAGSIVWRRLGQTSAAQLAARNGFAFQREAAEAADRLGDGAQSIEAFFTQTQATIVRLMDVAESACRREKQLRKGFRDVRHS